MWTILDEELNKIGVFQEVLEHVLDIVVLGLEHVLEDLEHLLAQEVTVLIVLQYVEHEVEDILLNDHLVYIIIETTECG